MFGLFKKKIPAPEWERVALVKRLCIHRYESDPTLRMMIETAGGCHPSELDAEVLMSTPESTILRVVEQFFSMRDQGATDEFAIMALNELHSALLSTVGEVVPILRQATTLFEYVRHMLDAIHAPAYGISISDHFLIGAIQDVKTHYKR